MARPKKTKQPEDNTQQTEIPAPVIEQNADEAARVKVRPKVQAEWTENANVPFEQAQKAAQAAFARYEEDNGVKLAPPSMRLCEIDGKRVWHFYAETV